MNKNTKLQFYKLKLDYLTFNVPSKDIKLLKDISSYLSDCFQCNSKLRSKEPFKEKYLNRKAENKIEVEFWQDEVKYWDGTILKFIGNNANQFYKTLVEKNIKFMPSLFEIDFSIGRIDICYDRKITEADPSIDAFLEDSYDNFKIKYPSFYIDINRQTRTLKIGKRKSGTTYFRTYLKTNAKDLRFELELKKGEAKYCQISFFKQDFLKFEQELIVKFFSEAHRNFDITNPYLDWVNKNFRSIRRQPLKHILTNSLSATYFNYSKKISNEHKQLYTLLQLLSFIRRLDSKRTINSGVRYVVVEFPIASFLKFIGKPATNWYQKREIIKFLLSLLNMQPVLEQVSDHHFRSSALFPVVDIKRRQQLFAKLTLQEKLYDYSYPFHLPPCFLTYKTKNEFIVQWFILNSFAQETIEKQVFTREFFSNYKSSTHKSSELKKQMLLIFQEMVKEEIIEPEFEILYKDKTTKIVLTLTSKIINKSDKIFYKEKVKIN